MDWISTTTGCFAVSNALAKTASDLHRFVRDVRESRADLAPLSAELHALDGVLDLLKDDAASVSFPADLALQTPAVVAGSGAVVADLDAIFSDGGSGSGDSDDDPMPSSSVSPQEKRARWLALRPHIAESRTILEVYRLALGLALDLVALTQKTHTADSDTADTSNVSNVPDATAKDMARLQAEISHLRTRVRSDLNDVDATFILLNYLNVLRRHTTSAEEEAKRAPEPEQKLELEPKTEPEREREDNTILNDAPAADLDLRDHDSVDLHLDPPSLQSRDEAVASPVGKAPDSAVGILDDEAADKGQSSSSLPIPRTLGVDAPRVGSSVYSSRQPSPSRQSRPSSPSMPPPPTPPPRDTARGPALLPPNEIDNLMDELRDELPSRPPTPPPKAEARGSSAMSFRPGEADHLGGANGGRYLAAAPTQLNHSVSNGNFAAMTTTTSSSTTAYPPSTSNNRFGRFLRHIRSTSATTTAEINKRPSTATGAVDLSSLSIAPTPLTNIVSSNSNSSSGQSGSSSGGGNGNGNGNGNSNGIERRTSRRFSASFRAPWAVTTVIEGGGAAPATSPAKKDRKRGAELDDEPDAVFGVSLRKSIHMAGASARTHHSGGHGASRREFPLSVFRCYTFIRSDGGLETPDIFGGGVPGVDVDSFDVVSFDRVRALRERFSTGPLYGVDLDDASMAAEYSRHDAAAVILQYLEALPRPLVSDSVARRWVTLSRQATITGSYSKRLDQCIDFWEEALGGVRGPARSLLKLLLNLWGDIADAADRNDMTAERLAGRVLRPLMQLDGGQYHTDYMLSLAFIIRKRSEYALLLRGGGRKSNAAFET
ncbi:hypothetical protein HMPREF1624_01279 [Sporothrix schenckii ATCC 58251]|uniref:Rho-GAP domain-containing protein n=1 Tax=Sporothrix schenckii (strain ATCC 58251 / de Perez 2211183) TaxID=1391915 RepID=U7Q7H9_SPOS1|nr:hypothetical protein HMPREF1624_01279 [Sporothrix schenckii ATCC 58251]